MEMRIPVRDTRNTGRLLAVFQSAVVLVFAALLFSFWHFHVGQHARFLEMAENNHQRRLSLRAPRGVVFDRDGSCARREPALLEHLAGAGAGR